jgi:hypothetical protein
METEKVEYCSICKKNEVFMYSGSMQKRVCLGCEERAIRNIRVMNEDLNREIQILTEVIELLDLAMPSENIEGIYHKITKTIKEIGKEIETNVYAEGEIRGREILCETQQ